MKIYEIDREIENLMNQVDEETGEVLFDPEKLEELEMQKEQKIENLALLIKNKSSDIRELREEEKKLAERRRVIENQVERARQYLEFVLKGEKFQTAKVAVSYRKSTKVQVDGDFLLWAQENREDLLRYKDPEPDKTALTALLKGGEEIPHAELVTETSMTIK